MTRTQAKKKLEAARKTGRARFYSETDKTTFDIWYDEDTKQYSLSYRDGHYEQTVTVTYNPAKIEELIID